MNQERESYEEDIVRAVSTMNNHGVILYPTDTIWGLGCNAHDEIAIQQIFEIKKRDAQKYFVLLMTDVKQLSKYIANPFPNLEEMLARFDTPTTIVYENAINLPSSLIANDGTIAVRITSDSFCRSLIKRLRNPIVSTSANLSGQVSPSNFSQIDDEVKGKVNYMVKWKQNNTELKSASSIFKLNTDGTFLKLR